MIPAARRRPGGIGAFFDAAPLPNDPAAAAAAQLLGSMIAQPGLRLDARPASGRFYGAGLSFQEFVRQAAQPNSAENLEIAGRSVNSRRSLGRHRGFYPGP